MKKFVVFLVFVVLMAFVVDTVFAAKAKCPQKRKTKKAPSSLYKQDKTAKADAAAGKKIYIKTAKPMACLMCHGKKGDGTGKLGAALTPKPRNFKCKKTMKDVTPGQMFWIIKKGSKGTGMIAQKTLKDKDIWNVIKYIRTKFMK
ncbi:MAG: cytochrome c [Nitrospina sp.]|nr:MAG: cytochrome c [Nitrospina sp.]TDJ62331.1 MAG: cytochrome c [Nitrospina sp.]